MQAVMREDFVNCLSTAGFHRMAYVEWGAADNPRVLVCVHGLTRSGRDFDTLAQALAADYRVVCPDVAGRGKSDWLRDKALYAVPQYCADLVTLLARLNVEQVDWLGTSMGGLIGMALAAQPGNPIRRLILNDVGPVLTATALARIGEYLGTAPRFDDMAQAEQYVRTVSAPFGPHTDAQWRQLTKHVVRRAADGKIEFAYDPGIAHPFRADQQRGANQGVAQDVTLWPLYDAIACPTLLLRGAQSDLLTPQTAQAMSERGPRAQVVEIPGVGHAPTLMNEAQIAPVREFLRQS